ncbi:MAG: AAA family ATPase, partial [Sulfurimonas sp.]|uniref:AAA family ATPase n=1 Tax=Sulfurimonas sp. TaxID=2022749 RepID=UPI0026081419
LSVASYCLSLNVITNVIYLDLDNSLVTLADRDVDKLKELYKDKLNYIHSTTATKYDMQHLLMMMSHSVLDHVMIIFDSAKNFMSDGKDRDSNKDVTDFMQIVKDIRDSGATVIMLHHVNKPQKDVETIFAGAAAWMEDVSSLFMLKQNRYKNCFILTPHKERVGALCEVAYIFEKSKNEITECELFYAKETQEDEEIRNCIYEFIKNHASKPTYSEILKHCTQNNGYSKNKVNAVIQAARQHYWKAIKEKENHNRDVYILLDRSDKLDSSKSIIKDS